MQMRKQYLNLFIVALFVLLVGGCEENNIMAKEKAGSQVSKRFEKEVTKTLVMDYLLYLPKDYGKSEQKWPLMLFLHGAGERGDDLKKVKVHGPPKLIEHGKEFGFVIVSPQCPEDWWWPEKREEVIALLDDIESRYDIDTDRVYLTGLSMGGFGSWAVASRYPERFAAMAPICGGIEPFFAQNFKDLPIWAFHGAKDQIVPLSNSAEIVEEIKKLGGDAKLTVYPEVEHGGWTVTYENPRLYEWFLEHRISDRKKD
jgi:predicted peptidase